jgi:hypothetical protein
VGKGALKAQSKGKSVEEEGKAHGKGKGKGKGESKEEKSNKAVHELIRKQATARLQILSIRIPSRRPWRACLHL